MQDLESLSSKTILELREIGKVLGIKGALKKQELIDRIISVATKGEEKNSEEVEQVASESGSTQPKRRRGRPARSAQKTESEQQPEDNIEVQPVPAAAPAPTMVCSSSMNKMICPSLFFTSSSTAFKRSSNSPRYFAPATNAPISSE